jgi:hypothetical protein
MEKKKGRHMESTGKGAPNVGTLTPALSTEKGEKHGHMTRL